MKKLTFYWILISGVIISLTGILHNIAAPGMYRAMKNDPAIQDKAEGLLYFFIFMGTSVLYAGLLTVFSSFGVKKSAGWAWTIAFSSGIFIFLGALAAIFYARFANPLIYAMGFGGLSNVVVLLLSGKKA